MKTRNWIVMFFLVCYCVLVFALGYVQGKRVADHWYGLHFDNVVIPYTDISHPGYSYCASGTDSWYEYGQVCHTDPKARLKPPAATDTTEPLPKKVVDYECGPDLDGNLWVVQGVWMRDGSRVPGFPGPHCVKASLLPWKLETVPQKQSGFIIYDGYGAVDTEARRICSPDFVAGPDLYDEKDGLRYLCSYTGVITGSHERKPPEKVGTCICENSTMICRTKKGLVSYPNTCLEGPSR